MPYHWAKAAKKPISESLQRLVDAFAWADAYIFVTPEYNFALSPSLLNLLDHVPPVAYGGYVVFGFFRMRIFTDG